MEKAKKVYHKHCKYSKCKRPFDTVFRTKEFCCTTCTHSHRDEIKHHKEEFRPKTRRTHSGLSVINNIIGQTMCGN